jgi:hypothetical protein
MENRSIVQKFHSMVYDLQNNPAINLDVYEFNPPATEEELNEARSKFNLTPEMIDLYSEANGIEIYWQRAEEVDIPGGGLAAGYINLLPVQEVFKDWKNIIYFSEDDPCKPLHPIDFFIGNACAALYLDGSDNPEVYYYYRGERMRPLGVDFLGYLELLLKSRGFWYWHLAIAGPEYINPAAPMSIEERNFRKIMPQLFSDFRQSDFQRLNAEINQENDELYNSEANKDNSSIALSTLSDFLETEGWNHQALEDGQSYKIFLESETGQRVAYAEIIRDLEQFLFYVKMPVKVPEKLRNTIAEFITRANYGLGVGNFEMDYDDGEVSYKSCIDFKGESLTNGYIRNAIYPAIKTMELYESGLMSVIDGEQTPEEAIAELEKDDD